MSHIGRNNPCPCGSGKKYKRCCLNPNNPSASFRSDERTSALAQVMRFVAHKRPEEGDEAYFSFYDRWDEGFDSLDEHWTTLSEAVFNMWLCFDRRLEDGTTLAQVFLATNPHLTPGERFYIESTIETAMRLYEVEDLRPGESVHVRDVTTGARLRVRERMGSRGMSRNDLLAARVMPRGPSGLPEFEPGLLDIPGLVRDQLLRQVEEQRARFRSERPGVGETELFKELAPVFHDAWITCLLDPPLPDLKNTDGDDLLLTRVRFEVTEPSGLEAALDGGEGLEREEEGKTVWRWSGVNPSGQDVSLGRIVWEEKTLELECNSARRGERGRALIEAAAAGRVRHQSTTHENLKAILREHLRAKASGAPDEAPETPDQIPWEVQEAVTLDHFARYYRSWLDEPIPALDDQTPRQAVDDPELRPRLAELIRGLEGHYQTALRKRTPAYDPSWMWEELGFATGSDPSHPPPLAYERAVQVLPELEDLCRAVGEQARQRPGFDDASTIVTAAELASRVDVRSALRRAGVGEDPGPEAEPLGLRTLTTQVPFLVNFALHRRKTFWVDEALAYMLAKTDLDVPGSDVRVPFPCFALAFTDRYTLGMAERLLSRDRQCPAAGHFLRVATVYVIEEPSADHRVLHLGFALDTLGADLPYLVTQDVPLRDDTSVRPFIESLAPEVVTDPPVPDANPLRGLVHTTLNAILYATSAGVDPVLRVPPPRTPPRASRRQREPVVFSSESVFFLPGAIEISQVRRMQELERIPSGRSVLHRFMVRGHWRRAARDWKDQRLRWIEPYWRGPDIAAVIERTYKLKP